ncbi:MAG: 7-cyano-7-deazaguanine synthase QueC [Deltaproteobacteria bacterium]|nr:7-cyano-7-deazaguanine synthase QueC [Deltaproteobacteria bacterium]
MSNAITLLSGGLDSFISTHIALQKHKVILALTFDYGQRAAKREISAAGKMCRLWKIPHQVVDLPWLAEITNTALVNRSKSLCHSCGSRNPVKAGDPCFRRDDSFGVSTARAVWVPNRNGLFINAAASFAESFGAKVIITGFNKEEAVTFPDNGPRFVKEANDALKFSTLNHPKVISFTQEMTKSDMIKYVVLKHLPIELCWPCYEGGRKLCGKCESCMRFNRALAAR